MNALMFVIAALVAMLNSGYVQCDVTTCETCVDDTETKGVFCMYANETANDPNLAGLSVCMVPEVEEEIDGSMCNNNLDDLYTGFNTTISTTSEQCVVRSTGSLSLDIDAAVYSIGTCESCVDSGPTYRWCQGVMTDDNGKEVVQGFCIQGQDAETSCSGFVIADTGVEMTPVSDVTDCKDNTDSGMLHLPTVAFVLSLIAMFFIQ